MLHFLIFHQVLFSNKSLTNLVLNQFELLNSKNAQCKIWHFLVANVFSFYSTF